MSTRIFGSLPRVKVSVGCPLEIQIPILENIESDLDFSIQGPCIQGPWSGLYEDYLAEDNVLMLKGTLRPDLILPLNEGILEFRAVACDKDGLELDELIVELEPN